MKSALETAQEIAKEPTDAVAGLRLAWDHARMAGAETVAKRCELITDFQRLEELFFEWQRLWESDPRAEVFQTPAWARAWWQSYGKQVRLCTAVVFAGDRPASEQVIGILPLVEQDGVIRFLGTPEADYADIICAEHNAAEVMALALQALLDSAGWSECGFHHLSKHSRLARHYPELPREIRNRLHCLPAGPLQTIILRHQREDVFKALLGKQHTRRLQNKLRKAGDLRFRLLDSSQDIDPYLPEFFRHHVRRHLSVGRQSSFADAEFCRFIQSVIAALTPTSIVRFGVLELNGQPLAWNLGFEVNGKFLLYQHTFDLDRGDFTPGEVLLWNALEYAKDHVSREFDFGRGDELYKDRFTNYSRDTFSLFLEPYGVQGQVRGLARTAQRLLLPAMGKVKQVAKSRRATLRAYRALRMWTIANSCVLRQAKQNGKLLACTSRLARELFGNSVWSRKATDVFAPVQIGEVQKVTIAASGNDRQTYIEKAPKEKSPKNDLDISIAQLGDLVDLSSAHPEILGLHQLEGCRRRMKSGERAYLVRDKSQVVSLCWVSAIAGKKSNPEENAAEAGKNEAQKKNAAPQPALSQLRLSPDKPAMIVSEFWSASNHDLTAAYGLLLQTLQREAAIRKVDLLILCSSGQPQLREALDCRGFAPKFRSVQRKIFGRSQPESISTYPSSTYPDSTHANSTQSNSTQPSSTS
jgi:CelD/BcsL family acetyltransferase involved in cellulose biosynthesis